tara:strand:- start:1673 stop:2500 length:828 start_codon:yes stop_codon:yes gene_type:complete
MVLVSTTTKAAITGIFIVVVGLLIWGFFTDGFYSEVFELATFDEEEALDQDNTISQETLDKITTNIQECCYGTCFGKSDSDASQNEDCFCFTQSFSELPEGATYIVQNSAGKSKITATNTRKEDLGSTENSYALGLLYVSGVDNSISCLYPTEFTITGDTSASGDSFDLCDPFFGTGWCVGDSEGEIEKNIWKVVYNGEEYGFYQDLDLTQEYESLAYESSIYKVDDDHICLVTTLLQEEISTGSLVSSLNLHDLPTGDFSEVATWITFGTSCNR